MDLQVGKAQDGFCFILCSTPYLHISSCVCWPKGSWIHQQGAYSIQAQFYQEKDCCRIIPWNQEVQLQYLRSSRPGRGLKTWAIWGKETVCSVAQLSLRQLLETAKTGMGMFVCLFVYYKVEFVHACNSSTQKVFKQLFLLVFLLFLLVLFWNLPALCTGGRKLSPCSVQSYHSC